MAMPIKRVLVPVDFSGDSLNALAYARDLVKPFHAEVILVHVVEPIYYAAPADMYMTSPNLAGIIEEQQRMAAQQLKRIAGDLEKKGHRVRTVLKNGVPAQVIIDSAQRTGTDLIVMATHGHTGLAHLFMGSVAEKVVRTAACPVLTVRSTLLQKRKRRKGRASAARGSRRS
jgi:nucleotide-binding universal stress UspA family protein